MFKRDATEAAFLYGEAPFAIQIPKSVSGLEGPLKEPLNIATLGYPSPGEVKSIVRENSLAPKESCPCLNSTGS